MPASRMLAEPGERRPSRYAASVASRLPAKAASEISAGCCPSPKMMAPTAPTAPPADTPTSPGSASGLRNSACITAPASASPLPTSTPSRMRGRRMSTSTPCQSCHWGSVLAEGGAAHNSSGSRASGMATAPESAAPMATATSRHRAHSRSSG